MTEAMPVYRPDGRVLRGYMVSDARIRVIRGPIRSGTSTASLMELFRRAREQEPCHHGSHKGIRRSRWVIVRNTYNELDQSTIRTWLQWFPEHVYGPLIRTRPVTHHIRHGDIDAEFVFLALDSPDDVGKLRSTEWTGGFINELEFIPKEIFDELVSRVGYFPPLIDGGATWSGLIADLNAPSSDHWLPMMTGESPLPEDMPEQEKLSWKWPQDWAYFVQPPGLREIFGADGRTVVGYEINPDAENLKWIPKINGEHRYLVEARGKSKRWIDSRIMNRIIPPVLGQPVWPMFRREVNVPNETMQYVPGRTLFVGLDFGRRPAAVFGQIINDRWRVLSELLAKDVGASTFAPQVKRHLEQRYPDAALEIYGDPKGNDKVQSDERTAYDVFHAHGLKVRAAPVPDNAIKTRIEAVENVLNEMRDGLPRFMVNAACTVLVAGMSGGYHFGDNPDQNGEFKPDKKKGRYSDVCDALQYMMLGAGEGAALTGRARGLDQKPRVVISGTRGSGRRRMA